MTVCKIHKYNAEARIKQMYKNNCNIKDNGISEKIIEEENEIEFDLEEYIFDKISEHIIRKFKGNKMELL